MDFYKYFKTPLEQWIEEQYLLGGILTPHDLDIDKIAMIFGVDIVYYENSPFSENEDKVIFIDRRDDYIEQRKIFFHELCHVLRHSGDQRWMPEMFREAQENDADRFMMYATIPFFMLEQMPIPTRKSEAVSSIAAEFQVFPDTAELRLKQIEERINETEFITSITYELNPSRKNSKSQKACGLGLGYLQEPRIRALYSLENLSRPQALVIEQRHGFNWDKPLHVSMERNYKSHDSSIYRSRHEAIVLPGDLSLSSDRVGYVTINLSRVAWRHGQTATRLYLPMEAVDDAINF